MKTGGRQRGTPNKVTVAVREAIVNAFEEVGGQSYLVKVAREDPRTFLTLVGKIVPREIEVDAYDPTARIAALNEGRARARRAIEARDRARKKLAEAN